MNFINTDTATLITTWNNVIKGFDKVAESLDNNTFHTAGEKGAAPPSQAGQTTLWFALAIDAELNRRGIPENLRTSVGINNKNSRPRR